MASWAKYHLPSGQFLLLPENGYMPDQTQLQSFYLGAGIDSRGRTLREIQAWSDDELERTHDYIQWLFPLSGGSLRV